MERALTTCSSPVPATTDVRMTLACRLPGEWARLQQVLEAAGLGFSWKPMSAVPARSGSLGGLTREDRRPAVNGSRADAGGLLIEALDVKLALRCLEAVRADLHLRARPVLLAVRAEQLSDLVTVGDFDDFVLLPYSWPEVVARLRAAEQRRKAGAPPVQRESDGMVVDPVARVAIVGDRTVRMTGREFALLSCLRAQRGSILSRQDLLSSAWGRAYHGGPRTVDTHIGRLRQKFGDALPIETVRATGYRLLPCRSA